MQMLNTATENKKRMAEIYDAIMEGDPSKFVAHLAEDAVFTVPGENSWSGVHHGKNSIIRFFRLVGELTPAVPGERRTIPFRILADEDWVIMEAHGDMTTRTGVPYRNHYCFMFRLRDGMIVEMKEYLDSAYCERVLGYFPADRMKG